MKNKHFKIAVFADNFLPQVNGVVTTTVNLCKGLAERGHKVLIIAPKYHKNIYPDFGPNIQIITVRGLPALFYPGLRLTLPFHRKIYNALIKNKIEILHFHVPMTLGVEAVIFAKLLHLPLIGTFHTFFGDSEYLKHAKLDYERVKKFSWQFSNLFYNRCNLVTTPTQTTKKILKDNKCTRTIKVISNGIDPQIFDNTNSPAIKQKYNPDGPLCLFVGRIAYEKNLTFLIECFQEVLKKCPTAKLLIVGGGPQFKQIQNKVEKLKLTANIILTGEIPHAKLVKSGIYGACDLFVTASKTESQGLTTLEAQANGMVSIGMKVKGISDCIINGINGYLVEPDNKQAFAQAIVKLLNNRDLLEKFKQNTLQEVHKHYLPNIITTWEKTYSEIIEKYHAKHT